jgi:hypothetical protein
MRGNHVGTRTETRTETVLVLFLEVMLCPKQLVAGPGLGGARRTCRWYTKIELILVSVEP